MATYPSFATVEDWVKQDFTVSHKSARQFSEKTLSRTGKVIRTIQSLSPAGRLGLKEGDILFYINGELFTDEELARTYKPRWFRRSYKFEFLRPSTRRHITVVGKTFPFGMELCDTLNGFATALRNGDPDPHNTEQFWVSGSEKELAALWPALEAYNIRLCSLRGAPYEGEFPESVPTESALASEDSFWPGSLTWIGLSAAYAGHFGRAHFILNAVEDYFERSGRSAMMNMFAAMATIRSMLAEHEGNNRLAIAHMHHAIELSPPTEILYSRLSALTGSPVNPPPSPFLGVKPSYDLPITDPSGRFIQEEGRISIRERVNLLKPGQFILLTSMSGYRVNGPYVAGYERALMPLSRLREVFKEVHIITSWDEERSRDLNFPIMEPALRRKGVEVFLLYDEDNYVADQLSLVSAPTNLVLDHKGIVVAEGWLVDDKLLWQALETVP